MLINKYELSMKMNLIHNNRRKEHIMMYKNKKYYKKILNSKLIIQKK